MTEQEIESIRPLLNGQEMKEITLKMFVEEMADWWSNGWGWWFPWKSMVDSIEDDEIFKKAVEEMGNSIKEKGFDVFLQRFTGCSQERKDKYFTRKFGKMY